MKKLYRVVVSYIVPFEQIVEYIVEEPEDMDLLKNPDYLEEVGESEVLQMSQIDDPTDPVILEIEEIKNN